MLGKMKDFLMKDSKGILVRLKLFRVVLFVFFAFLLVNLIGALVVFFSANKRITVGSGTGSERVACVGVFDVQNPRYTYKLNTYNTVMSIVFIETILIPIYVANNYLLCPSGLATRN